MYILYAILRLVKGQIVHILKGINMEKKYTIKELLFLLEEYNKIESNHANCCNRRFGDDPVCCEETIMHFIDFIDKNQFNDFLNRYKDSNE